MKGSAAVVLAVTLAGCGMAPGQTPPPAGASTGGAEAAAHQASEGQGLMGLNLPLPKRTLQQLPGEGPKMWGFQFVNTWQREETVTRHEPSTPKYHYISGEIIGWWPPVTFYYNVIVNGATWNAPGLSKVEHLSDRRFLLTVPQDKVWVVTQVLRPEGITLNGIPLGSYREGPSQNYDRPNYLETVTPVRILAGPGQQVFMNFSAGASMHGVLDDPAAYGNAFGGAPKYQGH